MNQRLEIANMSYLLTRTATQRPEATATWYKNKRQTYSELNERASRVANALSRSGVKKGDRIAVGLNPRPEALEIFFGILRMGGVIVPMKMGQTVYETKYILELVRPCLAICEGDIINVVRDAMSQLDIDSKLVSIGDKNQATKGLDYESWIGAESHLCEDREIQRDDVAWIFLTSGTTGRPKGAMLTHGNLHAMVVGQLISVINLQPGQRVAYLSPMAHAAGLLVFQCVAKAVFNVFPDDTHFRPEKFYRLVKEAKVNVTFLAPTMIERLLENPPTERELETLTNVLYGGAPMYVERLKDAIQKFGLIFTQVYAVGEAPMSMTVLPAEEHEIVEGEENIYLRSAGKECHYVEIQTVDENGKRCENGVAGEIVVRGPVVMKGYWENEEATTKAIKNGWLYTGDVGHIDKRGYLYITDRNKDMIITGGLNVYPREVEEVIYKFSGVREACVFGIPDQEWGEKVVAAVVMRRGERMQKEDVIMWCKEHLAKYKVPRAIAIVEELPKSTVGKILKRKMRERYIEEKAREANA